MDDHRRMSDEALLARMRAEFREMPGLKLTARQARRLLGLEAPTCDTLLEELVQTGFLRCTRDGRFIRADAEMR
jgi:DNA-binding IclR family transcriptional regulator